MKNIMRDFLLPAGYEFQKVANDFERLLTGKELFDQDALRALEDCDDNNSRYDMLQRFAEYVLPHYDDLASVQSDIRAAVVRTVERARQIPTRAIETPFGALSGHSVDDIVDVAANILDHLRYVDPGAVEATFDAICALFLGAATDEERKRLLQSATSLSKHRLNVWKAAGPLVQDLLLERIRRLDSKTLALVRPVILEILDQVLQAELQGTSVTYDTLTIHMGWVHPSDMLFSVRSGAIKILKNLFRDANTDARRREIAQVLLTATRTPHIGGYPIALLKIVLENAKEIVAFYTAIAPTQSHELMRQFEHDLLWLYRRYRDMPAETSADAEIASARDQLTSSIVAFRDLINQNRAFCVYKILVGYQSVFAPAWDDDNFEVNSKDNYRAQRITDLVNEVTEANAEEWFCDFSVCSHRVARSGDFSKFREVLGGSGPLQVSNCDRVSRAA